MNKLRVTFLFFIPFSMVAVSLFPSAYAEISLNHSVLTGTNALINISNDPNQSISMDYVILQFNSIGNSTLGSPFIPNSANFTYSIENSTMLIDSYDESETSYSGILLFGASDIVFYLSNISVVLRTPYNITLNVTDQYGNSSKFFLREIRFIDNPLALERFTFTANSSNMTSVNASGTVSTSIDFKFRNFLNGSYDIARYDHNPENENATSSVLGKFIEVEMEPNVTQNLEWAILRIHYTDQDLVDNNVQNEANLAFYLFNETTGDWEIVPGSGVDTTNNFVYMNTTHFSTYGVFEQPSSQPPAQQSSGGGGGGGTYVPIAKKNETNSTHTIIREELDCAGLNLPEGGECNESWVYVPERVEIREVEKRVEVVKEEVPVWSYAVMGIMAAAVVFLLVRGRSKA